MKSLFYEIPNEIQQKIIALIVTQENLISLKLVSKKFKRLVEQVYNHNEPNGIHFWWNISNGNREEVARLLQDKYILNEYNYFSDICFFGDLPTVEFLINDPRVDPNTGQDHPILEAYVSNRMDIFGFLLGHPKVNLQDDRILKRACDMGITDAIKLLLSSGRMTPSPLVMMQEILHTCASGKPQVLKVLLTHSQSTFVDIHRFIFEITRSGYASEDSLNILIDQECISLCDWQQMTRIYEMALYCSIAYGFMQTVKRLTSKPGVMFGEDSICSFESIQRKDVNIQKHLVQHEYVFMSGRHYGKLVHFDDMELIRMAIERNRGSIPFMVNEALYCQKGGIVMDILKGVDLSYTHQKIVTSLACKYNQVEIVQFLLSKYKISYSSDSFTIFEYACHQENYRLVQLLLENRVFEEKCFAAFMRDTAPFLLRKWQNANSQTR